MDINRKDISEKDLNNKDYLITMMLANEDTINNAESNIKGILDENDKLTEVLIFWISFFIVLIFAWNIFI